MKKALIIVDMQNDFIDGSLGTPEAKLIVPHVINKIKNNQNETAMIIFTKDTHSDGYLNTQEGKHLPIVHCIENTEGWEISRDLQKAIDLSGYRIFEKNTFGSRELAVFLSDYASSDGLDEIEFCGLCTDICVIFNALVVKAFLPEANISVDSSCCAGVTPESHKNALKTMEMCHINIVNE